MNIAEFGKTVKSKHPEYNDIPDAELGARVLNKYPEYKDMVDTTTIERRPTSFGTTDTPDPSLVYGAIASGAKAIMPSTVKEGLEQAGGVIGELTAGPYGAGIGSGAMNIMGQMYEQGAVPPMWAGGSYFTPPITPEGGLNINWNEAGAVAGTNVAAAGLGKAAARLGMKASHPASRTINEEAVAAEKFIEPYGGRLSPQQKTEGVLTNFFGNMTEYAATSKRTMEQFHRQYQSEPVRSAIADIANKLGRGNPVDDIDAAGLHLAEGIMGNKKAIAAKFAQDYAPLDEIAQQPSVDMNELLELANEIVTKQPVRGSESGRIAQNFIDKLQPMETFERAMIEQSDLFELPGGTKQLIGNYDKKNITKMRRAFIKAIDKAAKEIDMPIDAGSNLSNYQRQLIQERNAADMIKELRRSYAREMKPFNSRWVNQVYNTEGGTQIFNKVFNERSPSRIIKLKEALGSQKKWEELQAAWMQDKLKSSWITDDTGLFDYKKMVSEIEDMGDSYKVLFDGSQRKAIDDFVNTVRVLEKKRDKTGAIWIQLKQASAIASLSTIGGAGGIFTSENKGQGALTGVASGAAFAFAAPYGLAKIFTNPVATKYLSRALSSGKYNTIDELAAQMNRFLVTGAASKLIHNEEEVTSPSQ